MNDRLLTAFVWVLCAAIPVGTAIVATWFFATHGGRTSRMQRRQRDMAARQAPALQAFAAQVGGRFEPGGWVEVESGVSYAWPGSVVCACQGIPVTVAYWTRDLASAEGSPLLESLPRVSIDVPPGVPWAYAPASRAGLRIRQVFGDKVREIAAAGRDGARFREAFGVEEDSLPAATRALLWWVGEHASSLEFSPQRVDFHMWPADVIERRSFLETEREGGYDLAELARFMEQSCALTVALMSPRSRP
jgi:hypothetical protein